MRLRNAIGIGLLGWAALVVSPALAQYGDYSNTTTESMPGTALLSASNAYLNATMRRPGIVRTIRPGSGTTPAAFVGYSNYRGGRVYLRATGGDPFTTADDGRSLLSAGPYSTYSTVRLGQQNTGTTGQVDTGQSYEIETLFQDVSQPTQNPFVAEPARTTSGLSFTWQLRESHPEDTAVLNNDVTVRNAGLAGSTSNSLLQVKQTYTLVRDMMRVEVEVVNVGTADQIVGVQTYFDGSFGGSRDDGTAFYVSDVREPLTTEFLFPSTNSSDDAALRTIPNSWRTFDNTANPGVVLGGIFSGADISTASLSAGAPQQVMFVNANTAQATAFGYTPLRLSLAGADWGVLARWQSQTISPGGVKRFITYFGLGGADSDFGQPYGLSVEAPFSLQLANGDDPGTAVVETSDNLYREPNPFEVKAFVNNLSTRPLNSVSVSLSMPDGFSLDSTSGAITQTISTLGAGDERTLSWLIHSATTQTAGSKILTVSASGTGLTSKVIEREIGIPALPSLTFPDVTHRLDMVSVPYDFANRDIEHIFTTLGSIGVTGGGAAAVARYNPSARAYAFFPDAFITSLLPGEGIWLFNGSLASLSLPSDRVQLDPATSTGIALNPDWNMLGCPYAVPTRLFDTEVITNDNVTRTFSEAVNSGIVRPVLYEYSPNQSDPNASGTYVFSGDSNTLFNPWRGYWLRVLQQVTLVYNAAALIGPFRSHGPDPLGLSSGGWEFSLEAGGDHARSERVWLGQDGGAQDGYDVKDVDRPPDVRSRDFLRLAAVHADWGRQNGAYLRDIRSVGRSTRWLLETDTDQANQDVTLRWNLRGVPGDVQLTLVDLQSGARRHMRTTSGYTYNTGAFAGGRAFQVVATRGQRAMQVVSMQAVPQRGRGVSVGFSLTAAATVDVVIESLTGRRVRTVERRYEAGAGQNAVVWDGRDDQHRPVPAGQYRCRVLCQTPDGQQAVAERIVILTR